MGSGQLCWWLRVPWALVETRFPVRQNVPILLLFSTAVKGRKFESIYIMDKMSPQIKQL